MNEILARLGLDEINAGTWSGAESSTSDDAPLIKSLNPATGEVIASVRSTTAEEYDKLVNNARAAGLPLDRWYTAEELVASDETYVCATGIASGLLLEGVARAPGEEWFRWPASNALE